MQSYLNPVLASIYYRVLELEPTILGSEALRHAISILRASDILEISDQQLNDRLAAIAKRYSRYGVINPNWLLQKGLRIHLFLANARPGWLEHLTAEAQQDSHGISKYILYGDYDSLIILYGSTREAERQRMLIENDIYTDSLFLAAKSIPLIYRTETLPIEGDVDWALPEMVNKVAEHYDDPDLAEMRERFLQAHVLLGPVWLPDDHPRERLVAFFGLSLRGRHEIRPHEMLRALRMGKAVERALVHLIETDGHPYKYFAKLVCKDQDELDQATNEINAVKFGQFHVEGTTMVVANGIDQLPLFRSLGVSLPGELPSLQDVEIAAREMVRAIGADAPRLFNELEASLKLGILSALARIEEQFERTSLPEPWRGQLQEATLQFGNGALDGAGPALDGAVTAATNAVELAAKRVIKLFAENQFGLDHARAQQELKLPTKDFSHLTLGKILQSFAVIRQDRRFESFWSQLDPERLKLLSAFTDERNQWLHGAKYDLSRTRRIHGSADMIVRAIELMQWLCNDLMIPLNLPPVGLTVAEDEVQLDIRPERQDKKVGFFISYSSRDKVVARQISEGIRALGLEVFFDEWAIGPSESIVEKIANALSRHDTIAVLLSPNSINSKWVRKELNSALMAQLGGHDIRVLPLLVAPCEIPYILADIRYIDFSASFEDGFIELLQYVKQRRNNRIG